MNRSLAARAAALFAAAALLGAAHPPRLADAVHAEMNWARRNPGALADDLRRYRSFFAGKIVHYPGNSDGLITTEGVAAVDEAIAFLDRQPPLPTFAQSDLLASAAADLVADEGKRGATGHIASDGSNSGTRVRRRGGGSYVAETITYGPPSAREVVRQLVIDDDVPGRGHRRILFAGEFRYAGTACGTHARYRMMCVTVYGRTADGR